MSCRIVESQVYDATLELTEEFLSNLPVPYSKSVSNRRVEKYCEVIREGSFEKTLWATILCLEDGFVYRLDGTDTAVAFMSFSDSPFSLNGIEITHDFWECDTKEELRQCFMEYTHTRRDHVLPSH